MLRKIECLLKMKLRNYWNPDRTIKPIVLMMLSSGIRLGTWDYLKWKHVIPIMDKEKNSEMIAAKIIVYVGETEQYYSFITIEAYQTLKDWMTHRE